MNSTTKFSKKSPRHLSESALELLLEYAARLETKYPLPFPRPEATFLFNPTGRAGDSTETETCPGCFAAGRFIFFLSIVKIDAFVRLKESPFF